MADRQIDPARLENDLLRRWYTRSPEDLDEQRQVDEAERHREFFGGSARSHDDPDPGFGSSPGRDRTDVDPDFRRPQVDAGDAMGGALLDLRGAGPDDDGNFIEIGNPANPRLRKEYMARYGYWPQTEEGRNFDVAHVKAIADSGTNTLDNIRPMHPDEHAAEHRANGDYARWARRAAIARAFGGRVARALPPLSVISDVMGLLSGRIRTDSFDNFSNDMMGLPSEDDLRTERENQQRAINPNWKRGDPIVI